MDCTKIGKLILTLRKEKQLTQKQLADSLKISDRTISKWERGLGCPDVSLLNELSEVLQVNIEKILRGDLQANSIDGGNMKKSRFYICPVCGNALCSITMADITCCGRKLPPLSAQATDAIHAMTIAEIENDYYVTLQHAMDKQHYLAFAAYITYDRVLWIRLYPEQDAEFRFARMQRGGTFYVYCSQHGLFKQQYK